MNIEIELYENHPKKDDFLIPAIKGNPLTILENNASLEKNW